MEFFGEMQFVVTENYAVAGFTNSDGKQPRNGSVKMSDQNQFFGSVLFAQPAEWPVLYSYCGSKPICQLKP
jgi:hypothetical protein